MSALFVWQLANLSRVKLGFMLIPSILMGYGTWFLLIFFLFYLWPDELIRIHFEFLKTYMNFYVNVDISYASLFTNAHDNLDTCCSMKNSLLILSNERNITLAWGELINFKVLVANYQKRLISVWILWSKSVGRKLRSMNWFLVKGWCHAFSNELVAENGSCQYFGS